MSARIRVEAAAPYDVVVGHGVSGTLGELLGAGGGSGPGGTSLHGAQRSAWGRAENGTEVRRVAIVHPQSMRERAARLRTELTSDQLDVHLIEVPDGEAAKVADVLQFCWRILGEAGFTRSDVVIGFGGGATTDLAGFVAATWLRGVPFVNLPTTVLGMVDAAVGGKTGINTVAGKNMVGAFHEPIGVLCDLDLLATLPGAELRSGLAEVIKCGFIADPSILELVENAGSATVLDATSPILAELVTKGIRVKADVVAGDLRETGAGDGSAVGREALNYGHTLGHAIEREEQFTIRHGEAISVGMVFVAELARRHDLIDDELVQRHRAALSSLALPTTWAGAFSPLLAAMRLDKKTRGDQLRFVVLEDLAQPRILAGPDESTLRDSFAALTGGGAGPGAADGTGAR